MGHRLRNGRIDRDKSSRVTQVQQSVEGMQSAEYAEYHPAEDEQCGDDGRWTFRTHRKLFMKIVMPRAQLRKLSLTLPVRAVSFEIQWYVRCDRICDSWLANWRLHHEPLMCEDISVETTLALGFRCKEGGFCAVRYRQA